MQWWPLSLSICLSYIFGFTSCVVTVLNDAALHQFAIANNFAVITDSTKTASVAWPSRIDARRQHSPIVYRNYFKSLNSEGKLIAQRTSITADTDICKLIRQVASPAVGFASKLKLFWLVTLLLWVDCWPLNGSRVTRLMGFLPANFQLDTPFHSQLTVCTGGIYRWADRRRPSTLNAQLYGDGA